MKNIRLVVLGELMLFLGIFLSNIISGGWGLSSIAWPLDLPSLLFIAFILFPGLLVMGHGRISSRHFQLGSGR